MLGNPEGDNFIPQSQRMRNTDSRQKPVIDQPTRLERTADILAQLAEGELPGGQSALVAGSTYYRHFAAIERAFPPEQPASPQIPYNDLKETFYRLSQDFAKATGDTRWMLAETMGVVGNIIAIKEQEEAAKQAQREAEQRQIEDEIKAAQKEGRTATTRRWVLRGLVAFIAIAAGGGGVIVTSNHQTMQEQKALEAAKKANEEANKRRKAEQEEFERTHLLEGEGQLTPISFGNYTIAHPKYDPKIKWVEVNEPGSVYASGAINPPNKPNYGYGTIGLIGLRVQNYLNAGGQNEIMVQISSSIVRDQERLLRKILAMDLIIGWSEWKLQILNKALT